VLTWLGFGMVMTFMTLIMTRRLSPLVALISIPVLFALLAGFGGAVGEQRS
jgi:CitMHS family citrate-Mg2+:H+ or citrate-Ca2+:H+ symporter